MALQHLQHHPEQPHLHVQLPVLLVQLLNGHQQHALHSAGAHLCTAAADVPTAVPNCGSLP